MNNPIRYNPKSHSPAVYIPCWLIQVSTKLISNNAKILYGRLSQWANSSGVVYRSCPQLTKELGTGISSIERHLKELKDCGLIGTYHPQAGGVNYYEFYDHPWMHEPLQQELTYKSDPPSELTAPPVRIDGTPPSELTDINIKEIKRNNKDLKTLVDSSKSTDYTKDDLFMLFYNSYPNKQKPRDAHKAFKKLKPDMELVSMLVEDLRKRINNNWKGRHKNKIPHPSTYLNSREWEGEIVAPENNMTRHSGKPKYKTMDEILGNSLPEGFL